MWVLANDFNGPKRTDLLNNLSSAKLDVTMMSASAPSEEDHEPALEDSFEAASGLGVVKKNWRL
jgi:hypothetical protein